MSERQVMGATPTASSDAGLSTSVLTSHASMMSADFGKLIADETEKWGKVVKFSGAKPD